MCFFSSEKKCSFHDLKIASWGWLWYKLSFLLQYWYIVRASSDYLRGKRLCGLVPSALLQCSIKNTSKWLTRCTIWKGAFQWILVQEISFPSVLVYITSPQRFSEWFMVNKIPFQALGWSVTTERLKMVDSLHNRSKNTKGTTGARKHFNVSIGLLHEAFSDFWSGKRLAKVQPSSRHGGQNEENSLRRK